MGAQQSSEQRKLYVKDATGKPVAIPSGKLAEYISESQMTDSLRRLADNGIISAVNVYSSPAMTSSTVYYRGNLRDLSEKFAEISADASLHAEVMAILTKFNVAGNASAITDDIIAAINTRQFHKSYTFQTGDNLRDGIMKALDEIPSAASISRDAKSEVTRVFEDAIRKILHRVYDGGAVSNTGIVFAGGAYERISGGRRVGGDPKGPLGSLFALDLEHISKHKAEIAEKIANDLVDIISKAGYGGTFKFTDDMKTADKLRNIADVLTKRAPANVDAIIDKFTEAINSVFGVMTLDPGLPLDTRVRQMTELLSALSHGVTIDFYLTGVDIIRGMRQIALIRSALKEAHGVLQNRIAQIGQDYELQRAATAIKDMIVELERVVTNMQIELSTSIGPSITNLIEGNIERPRPGSSLAEKVKDMLLGLMNTGSQAIVASDALKRMGMTIDEYKKIANERDFWTRFVELTDPRNLKEDANIEEITRAADVLAKMLPIREDIAKSLSAKTGGDGDAVSFVVKNVDLRNKRTNVVMNTYRMALQSGISKIRATINAMIPAIGKELEIGTTMEKFIDLLRQLADIRIESPKIHLALLRYARDTQAVEARDRIIGTLRAVADFAKFAAKQPEVEKGAEYFNAIAASIEELLTAIEAGAESVRVVRGGSVIDGGADIAENIGDMTVRDRIRLNESVEEMLYAIRVTQFKRNLESAVTPFAKDVAGYEDTVLGPAVADRIKKIRESLKTAEEFYKTSAPGVNGNYKAHDYIDKDSISFVTEYYKNIISFWDAVQAIEMYLKNFTGSLIGNPSEISEIEMMMREVEIISEPYDTIRDAAIGKIFEYNFGGAGKRIPRDGSNNDIKGCDDYDTSKPYQFQKSIGALPFTCILKGRMKNLLSDTTTSLKSFIALKNLIAFFAHFGGRIGATKLKEVGRRTPGEIYSSLVTFMATSTFMFGVQIHHKITVSTGKIDDTQVKDFPDVSPSSVEVSTMSSLPIGMDTIIKEGVLMRPAAMPASAFKPVEADTKKFSEVLSLEIENKVFVALIKALAGKILVLSGMHDLISRPHTQYERIAIRTTIGGAVDIPKIIPEAVELYVRLPLFALFYRKHLSYEGDKGDKQIAILPDVAGSIFGEFINLMFNRFTRTELSLLTENEVRDMIAEVNTIYTKLAPKYPKETVMNIIREFTQVISRMIYLVKKEDYEKVSKVLNIASDGRKSYDAPEDYDVDILGDDDQLGTIRKPMPAETAIGFSSEPPQRSEFSLESSAIINKFRCKIEKQLSMGSSFSLRGSITATRVKIDQTTNETDKFRMICGLIRGTGTSTSIENLRSVVFAEILGTGLGILSGIHSILKRLQIAIFCSNAREIAEIIKEVEITDTDNFITNLKEKIKGKLRCSDTLLDPIIKYNIDYNDNNSTATIMRDANTPISGNLISGATNITVDMTTTGNLKSGVFYYPHAMRTLLEYLARASSETNGFIRVDISDRKLHVNFAGVEEYITQTINTLTKFVDIMRPHIDPDVVYKYTTKEIAGSLYWLQERLIERMITGRANKAGGDDKYIRLSDTAKHATEAFDDLIGELTVDNKTFRVNYVGEFAKMIAHSDKPDGSFRDADIISDPFDALLVRGTTRDKTVDTRFLRSFDITSEKNVYSNTEEGCLFAFNRLLAMFLRQVYDTSTGKIFNGLINNFAQGAFNSAIMKERNTYPDHLPKYWVNTGKTRDIYEPGNVEASECPLITYLNWLKDLPENFSKPFDMLDVPGKDTIIGGIHGVVAGLLIAWFATESDISIDDTKGIDQQSAIAQKIFDKQFAVEAKTRNGNADADVNDVIRRLLRALILVKDNFNDLTNQTIAPLDDAALAALQHPQSTVKVFIGIGNDPARKKQNIMLRAIWIAMSAAAGTGDLTAIGDLYNAAYNKFAFDNNVNCVNNVPDRAIINQKLTALQIQQQPLEITSQLGIVKLLPLNRVLSHIVLQTDYMSQCVLLLATIVKTGTVDNIIVSTNFSSAKTARAISGDNLSIVIDLITTTLYAPDFESRLELLSNGISHSKHAIPYAIFSQLQPRTNKWVEISKDICKYGYYDLHMRDRINEIPGIDKLSAKHKWLNLLINAKSNSNVIIRNRIIKSLNKEWTPNKPIVKRLLHFFALIDYSPVSIQGYDITSSVQKIVSNGIPDDKQPHMVADTTGILAANAHTPNQNPSHAQNEAAIAAYCDAYYTSLVSHNEPVALDFDEENTQCKVYFDNLYLGKWSTVASDFNIGHDIVEKMFSRFSGNLSFTYPRSLHKMIITNENFDIKISSSNMSDATKREISLDINFIKQHYKAMRLLPYLSMIQNLSTQNPADYTGVCTSLYDIISNSDTYKELTSDIKKYLFDDRKYEKGKTIIEKMLPKKHPIDKLIRMRCSLRDETIDRYKRTIDSNSELPDNPYDIITTNPKTSVRGKEIVRHIISLADYSDAEISDDVLGGGTFITYPGKTTETSIRKSIIEYHGSLHNAKTDAKQSDFMDNDEFSDRKIPDGDHVLFATLGHILYNILTVTDERTGIRAHLLESAADIPAHMRNKYRAILPFFRAAFHSLSQTCDLYIRVMEQTATDCFRGDIANDNAKSYDKVGYKFDGVDSSRMIGILRAITTGASAIVQDCTQTLVSIGDQPHYFETHGDSITAYRAQNNGADPIMPISPMLRVMMMGKEKNIIADELQPKYSFGEPAFKYQFAIRGLYHNIDTRSKPEPLNVLTAVDSMISSFNKFSYGGIKIDAPVATDIAKLLMSGFDFIHDVSRVKFYVVKPPKDLANVFATDSNSDANTTDALRIKCDDNFVPVQFGINEDTTPNVSNIIAVVENHNREDSIKIVARATQKDRGGLDPIIANIIDTNIIPIDIHVLSRQIPLHFIWNYAFTFDVIAGSIVYENIKQSTLMDAYFADCDDRHPRSISSARDAMFKMIIDPYCVLSRQDKMWVDRMLIGAHGVPGVGRIKFISDQIAGGILFGGLNRDSDLRVEIGPQTLFTAPGRKYITSYPLQDADANNKVTDEENEMYLKILMELTRQNPDIEQHKLLSIRNIFRIIRPATGEPKDMADNIIDNVLTNTAKADIQKKLGNVPDQSTAFKIVIQEIIDNPGAVYRDVKIYLESLNKIANVTKLADAKAAEGGDNLEFDYKDLDTLVTNMYNANNAAHDTLTISKIKFITQHYTDALPLSHIIYTANDEATAQTAQQRLRDYIANPITDGSDLRFNTISDEYGAVTFEARSLDSTLRKYVPLIHDMRMDTLLVRNLIHISLVFAIMQSKLRDDVLQSRGGRIASSMGALNPSTTQFFGFQSSAQSRTADIRERAVRKYI